MAPCYLGVNMMAHGSLKRKVCSPQNGLWQKAKEERARDKIFQRSASRQGYLRKFSDTQCQEVGTSTEKIPQVVSHFLERWGFLIHKLEPITHPFTEFAEVSRNPFCLTFSITTVVW